MVRNLGPQQLCTCALNYCSTSGEKLLALRPEKKKKTNQTKIKYIQKSSEDFTQGFGAIGSFKKEIK